MEHSRRQLAVVVLLWLSACRTASFVGSSENGGSKNPVVAPPTPTPVASVTPMPTPVPSPIPGIPNECQNNIAKQGVVDPVSHKTFKLLTTQLSYDEGATGCKVANPNGLVIYQGQELPDEILACRKALGTLWMRPSATSLTLWQPSDGGTEEASVKHWIICYY
jgi:hypothetical protein